MRIQSINYKSNFTGHGARHIAQVMNKLYDTAYGTANWEIAPNIIKVSSTMRDGTEVSGIASFERGRYVALTLPFEQAHYRSEFCKKIIEKYNDVVTKGKANRNKKALW